MIPLTALKSFCLPAWYDSQPRRSSCLPIRVIPSRWIVKQLFGQYLPAMGSWMTLEVVRHIESQPLEEGAIALPKMAGVREPKKDPEPQ